MYVNFDVFGWGDTLWMMAPAQAQPALVDSSRAATQALRLGFSPGEKYPPKNPRYRLDEYLKRQYPDRVFLLIWDEVHEAQHG